MADFSVTGLDGRTIRLADFAGQPAVINFWAGWCSACVKELPAFQSAAQQLPPNQVHFLFVNFQDSAASVTTYLSQLGFTQPVALGSQGDVAMQLHLVGLPTTFFVDGSGVLRSIHTGEISPEQLQSQLEALVPGGGPSQPQGAGAAAPSGQANAAPVEGPATTRAPTAVPQGCREPVHLVRCRHRRNWHPQWRVGCRA